MLKLNSQRAWGSASPHNLEGDARLSQGHLNIPGQTNTAEGSGLCGASPAPSCLSLGTPSACASMGHQPCIAWLEAMALNVVNM